MFLNSKQKKELFKKINQAYDVEPELLKELPYDIYLNKKKKFYFLTREATEFIINNNLRLEGQGLYIGQIMSNEEIRLSIEGSQILGPLAKKNILIINKEEYDEWIQGNEIIIKEDDERIKDYKKGFLIIKHDKDFYGTGKIIRKEEKLILLNYVPKTRYVHALFND